MLPLNSIVKNQLGFLIIGASLTHEHYTGNVLCEDSTNCLTEDSGLVLVEPNNEILLQLLLENNMLYLLEDGFSTFLLETHP